MFKKSFSYAFALLIVASMVLAACQPAQTTPTEAPPVVEPTAVPPTAVPEVPTEVPTPEVVQTTRKGGWLDEIVFSVVGADSALTQIEAGAIDIYANGLSSSDLVAMNDAGIPYETASGLYYDMLYNPAGPEFSDGRLNPFSSRKIREATNWLFDRDYLNQEIYAGGALPKYFAITTQFPDYADLADVARKLESFYAYDFDKAKEVIDAEMEALGATLVDGKWTYNDTPVTLILVIRNDSDRTRIPMGEYVASQFEALGFTVDRQLKTGGEASPIWIGSDPIEGQWHVYTAAWSATVLDRDQSNIFQEMYLNSSAQGIPAFLDNVSDPEFKELGDRLASADFSTVEERHDMMARALELSLQDSLQVFLIDGKQYVPHVEGLVATADLAAGVEGSQIYPHTMRWADQEGGTVRWATQDLFAEPWNPVAGSNWSFDKGVIRAVTGNDVVYDPFTGLVWPLRLESADVVIKEGLPVAKTLDWVNLSFEPEIAVPGDVWADWDATAQTFITAETRFPEGTTANAKITMHYPADLFETVKWHDGSNVSVADFVMAMIMTFDRSKPESAIYDEQSVPTFDVFMSQFKGMKIVSTDPLVVDYYTDTYSLDAELTIPLIWPVYANNVEESDWGFIAIANAAEAGGELAYSVDKALAQEVEQTSYIGGPSLEILAKYLDTAIAEQTIPYAPTLGEYLTAEEAVARYEALKAWYGEHGHFKIGTGPYFIDQAFLTEKTATVKQFADYPDLADRWAGWSTPKLAAVELDGPGQVKIGEEATFDVFITFNDEPYATDEIKMVKFLLYNASNEIVKVAEAVAVEDGQFSIVLDAATTSALAAGSNKLEVAVVPLTVSQPTFVSIEFVTAQ
ncbi:MAG TPA: ABC transporter substrate-binding protein [Bellilinea sp.]|nr:ABC transporter substrate-binding protein [Bellilinea sp.]